MPPSMVRGVYIHSTCTHVMYVHTYMYHMYVCTRTHVHMYIEGQGIHRYIIINIQVTI